MGWRGGGGGNGGGRGFPKHLLGGGKCFVDFFSKNKGGRVR